MPRKRVTRRNTRNPEIPEVQNNIESSGTPDIVLKEDFGRDKDLKTLFKTVQPEPFTREDSDNARERQGEYHKVMASMAYGKVSFTLSKALCIIMCKYQPYNVKGVFDVIAPAVGLSVGLAIGQTQIASEAAELVEIPRKCVHSFSKSEVELLDSFNSLVDILVATPGRLMDHITSTQGFTLEHLRFLVIDEGDRLLRQAYQDWLPHTLARISAKGQSEQPLLKGLQRGFDGANHFRAMKMVLSATLTRDPAKISQIKLCFPLMISSIAEEKRYQVPDQLQSYKLVTDADKKPLHLIALLQMLKDQKTIVFTASVTSTHRLYLLLQSFGTQLKAVEYSSLQHQQSRSKALAAFRRGDAEVLVASDAMTRGMDVEGVINVINYDVPVYAKTFVHRVGRTARAGKPGSSYTLLRREEVRHFKEMLQKVDNGKCKRFKLPASMLDELFPLYVEGFFQPLTRVSLITMTTFFVAGQFCPETVIYLRRLNKEILLALGRFLAYVKGNALECSILLVLGQNFFYKVWFWSLIGFVLPLFKAWQSSKKSPLWKLSASQERLKELSGNEFNQINKLEKVPQQSEVVIE
ncbi:hypothetical protein L7F22_006726 [Adiantum nelumboides]|nr:hypothetical protein [Adiantum nelumboides]